MNLNLTNPPTWLSVDARGTMHINANQALAEIGVEDNDANRAALVEKIKLWVKATDVNVPVIEEWDLT